LSLFSSLNFLRFSLDKNQIDFCPVRADFFGSAAGGHIRQAECKGAALKSEPRELGRANTLTIFFEMRSNFSKNEHHLGNGEIVGCGARNAAARCERRKGKIQVRREPP
jgi:hypothetical protein